MQVGFLKMLIGTKLEVTPSKLHLSVVGDDYLSLSQLGITDRTVVNANMSGGQEEEKEGVVNRRRLTGTAILFFLQYKQYFPFNMMQYIAIFSRCQIGQNYLQNLSWQRLC